MTKREIQKHLRNFEENKFRSQVGNQIWPRYMNGISNMLGWSRDRTHSGDFSRSQVALQIWEAK